MAKAKAKSKSKAKRATASKARTRSRTRVRSGGAKAKSGKLTDYLNRFKPEVASLVRTARDKIRENLPNALEFVYDDQNYLVIGYGPDARTSSTAFSITAQAKGVNLVFTQGSNVDDPDGLLEGSSGPARTLRIESPSTLEREEVQELMKSALENSSAPINPDGGHQFFLRSPMKTKSKGGRKRTSSSGTRGQRRRVGKRKSRSTRASR